MASLVICHCGKEFSVRPCVLAAGLGHCCSRSCAAVRREFAKKLNPTPKVKPTVKAAATVPNCDLLTSLMHSMVLTKPT